MRASSATAALLNPYKKAHAVGLGVLRPEGGGVEHLFFFFFFVFFSCRLYLVVVSSSHGVAVLEAVPEREGALEVRRQVERADDLLERHARHVDVVDGAQHAALLDEAAVLDGALAAVVLAHEAVHDGRAGVVTVHLQHQAAGPWRHDDGDERVGALLPVLLGHGLVVVVQRAVALLVRERVRVPGPSFPPPGLPVLLLVGAAAVRGGEAAAQRQARAQQVELAARTQRRLLQLGAEGVRVRTSTAAVESVLSSLVVRVVRQRAPYLPTTAVRGDCTYMEETAYVSAFKRFVAMYDSHGGAAPAQPALLHDRAGVRAAGPRGSGGNQDEKGRHRAAAGGAQANQEVIVKNEWKLSWIDGGGGDAVEFTRDHKPNDLQERARIESLGGRVQWYGCMDAQREPIEPYGAYRVNDNLAVARAIGDRDTRSFVISDADIRQYDIEYDKDEFIVIASDGLSRGLEQRRPQRHPRAWSQQYTSDRSIIKAAQRRREVQLTNYLVQEALFRGTSTTCPLWWSGCSTTPSFSD
ncbi:hypothetical protein ON010_g11031 [Phytophthora cinnamomi]|nr:hypothetical protein ON010_g11031 [Phytophthora cinnamomi]